jgi:hypothetical protein
MKVRAMSKWLQAMKAAFAYLRSKELRRYLKDKGHA